MNLVAKEYVAAQDETDPGVLVLSRFAGAAQQMHQALIGNPYDKWEVAGAIHQAIQMPLAERTERWEALMAGMAREDLTSWRKRFLADLERAGDRYDTQPRPG